MGAIVYLFLFHTTNTEPIEFFNVKILNGLILYSGLTQKLVFVLIINAQLKEIYGSGQSVRYERIYENP